MQDQSDQAPKSLARSGASLPELQVRPFALSVSALGKTKGLALGPTTYREKHDVFPQLASPSLHHPQTTFDIGEVLGSAHQSRTV